MILDDPDAVIDGEPFAHYVCHVTEVSPLTRDAAYHPVAGRDVAAPARARGVAVRGQPLRRRVPGRPSRRGVELLAHRLAQRLAVGAEPSSCGRRSRSPSTSTPRARANGFLRVVPGSHRGGTDDMPLGFDKVPGEMAVYCERGDLLLHHSDLWHCAARATDDGDGACAATCAAAGTAASLAPEHGVDDFVKNARR